MTGWKYFEGRRWADITRDERFFCHRLLALAETNRAGLLDVLRTHAPEIGLTDTNWEMAFEVCLYRDLKYWRGEEAAWPLSSAEHSDKRTFDLCLFNENQIIIIEAKAQQPFDSVQLKDFALDLQRVKKLTGIEPHLLLLASSRYLQPATVAKLRAAFQKEIGIVSWHQLSEAFGNEESLLRADSLYLDGSKSGVQLLELWRSGADIAVGRSGGIQAVRRDVPGGAWRGRLYSVGASQGTNWFSLRDFISTVAPEELERRSSNFNLPAFKVSGEAVEVEYEFDVEILEVDSSDSDAEKVRAGLRRVEGALTANEERVRGLNVEIDRLTNHADGIDNLVAVASGLLAAAVDIFWVGQFNFERGKAWSNHQVNDFVMDVAKQRGYEGERLSGAIEYLEQQFPVPHDNTWSGKDVGISARSHHLDDLAHHPTPIGLFFSILTQFTEEAYFQNSEGEFLPIAINEDGMKLIGTDVPSKIFCGTVNWFFHLVSDMSGSNKTAGVGMGIPGPVVSLLKELATIPGLDRTGLAKQLHDAFVKQRLDLRSELAIGYELGRQAVPVLINDVLVRAFYFIRRFTAEIREKQSLRDIDWKKTMPWNNRTIVRMLTIATGTFTAVDVADAAVRAGLKSREIATFTAQMLLRVNFVGVGRFAIAVHSDLSMGFQRESLLDLKIAAFGQQLHWANAKVSYLQADMWLAAERAETSLFEAEKAMNAAVEAQARAWAENRASLRAIGESRIGIDANNPGLISDIRHALKWG